MMYKAITYIGTPLLASGIIAACGAPTVEESQGVPAFSELDKNGDAQLSMEEARGTPELAAIYKAADTDHDGSLSIEEFSHATLEGTTVSAEAAAGYKFELIDSNGDMSISPDEAEARDWPALNNHFMAFDTDNDGRLDPAEFDKALEEGLTP